MFAIVAAVLVLTAAVSSRVLPSEGAGRAMTDDFARVSRSELGAPREVPTGGTWGTKDGYAYVVTPDESAAARTMAVVNTNSNNGSVSARIGQGAQGWGLVFRYKGGGADFWMLFTSPRFASIKVSRAAAGKLDPVGTIELAKQDPGTEIEVDMNEEAISVLIDGQVAGKFIDPGASPGGWRQGLVLTDPTGLDAKWTRFRAIPTKATPVALPTPTTAP